MSSLKDLLNPLDGPPETVRRPNDPPGAAPQSHSYTLPPPLPHTAQEAASTLAYFAASRHGDRGHDGHHHLSHRADSSDHDPPATPTPHAHHDSSSSDTVSSSPVPPVSPRRVAPQPVKPLSGFTQVLRASSSERDADGDGDGDEEEEDDDMGDDQQQRGRGRGRGRGSKAASRPPSSSPAPPPAPPPPPQLPAAAPLPQTTSLAVTAKKPKKRGLAKPDPPKKKGIAKPQKKKRKTPSDLHDDSDSAPRPAIKRKKDRSPFLPSATPAGPVSAPAPAPAPPPPLSPLPKYNPEGLELYCICRKPDSGKWMIGCDGCEDWFHGSCIHVHEHDAELIDAYFCPRCETRGLGPTTWKRKCRLSSCRRPAQSTRTPPSKYCCDDHGISFFEAQLLSPLSTLPTSSLAALSDAVPTAAEFRRAGHRMPTPPMSDENFRDYPEEIARLLSISAERTALHSRRVALADHALYVTWVHDAARRIHEELKLSDTRNLGKEICGYDERLSLGAAEWAEWRASEAGEAVFAAKAIPGREAVCVRKKCEKHAQWKALAVEEARLQERLFAERLVQLRGEEKRIKERQKRRAGRVEGEGVVKVEKSY